MIVRAKIEVEEFDNGITSRWEDVDGICEDSKSLGVKGKEAECIGKQIWSDVREILANEATDKVIIQVRYEIPD